MKNFFLKFWTQIKRVPWYGWLAGVILFGLESGLYAAAKPIIAMWSQSWRIIPITQGVDINIPFCPYFWIQMYFLWHPLALFGPIVLSVTHKEHFLSTIVGWLVGEIVIFLLFICCPSYMDRTNVAGLTFGQYGNLLEKVQNGKGFSYWLMKIIMKNDGGIDNYNLFPSFHCYMIVFAYLGLMRRKEIKVGHRSFWLVCAILICLSTLFTKQHYFFDMLTGSLMAIIMFGLFKLINPGKAILRKCPNFLIVEKLNWTHEKIVK